VRKCLGVLASVAVLWAVSWAQAPVQAPRSDAAQAPPSTTPAPTTDGTQTAAPSQAPASSQTTQESSSIPNPVKAAPKYPLTELFLGYSLAQAGFFNAGHWAQLSGWNASFSVNMAKWLGLVIDGSQFFGTSKITTGAAQAPFPDCPTFCPLTSPTFNVDTREYNIVFGAQFPYRKYARWTPFGEVLFGHDGVRGIASALPPGGYTAEVSSGLALLGGAGADYKVNDRFAVRIKADYLQSRTSFAAIGKAKQDNLRVSVGVVLRSVRKKRRTLEDETGLEQ